LATSIKQRALASVGSAARYVPIDPVQIFSFVASPSVRAEPWGLYQRLHRRGPIRRGPYGIWMVASHAEVTRVLRELPTSVDEDQAVGLPQSPGGGVSDFSRLIERTVLFTDPPDHTRLRRLVSRSFTPRTVEAMREPITELAERAVADVRARGSADLVRDLALPFPVAVIAELLGLPMADRDRFIGWARAIAPRLDISIFRDDAVNAAGNRGAREMEAYFDDLLDHPERLDPGGLLVALVAAEDEDDRLTRDEVVAMCAILLLAGFETTTNLVANSIHSLLARPESLAAIRDGDVDMALAVDELLRHDGPVQFAQRVVLEEVALGGHQVPSHSLIALLIGAANRDPLVFDRPDDLVLDRSPNPHLSFSSGIHHCLGAALARLEAAVAIPAILRGLPELELAGRPRWRDTFVLRGFTELPVRWRA
jgi:cytochrome P450